MPTNNPTTIDIQTVNDEERDRFWLSVSGPTIKLGNLMLFLVNDGAMVHRHNGAESNDLFAHYDDEPTEVMTTLVYELTPDKAHWKLAHNHVEHSADMENGADGFRQFWIDPEEIKRGEWVKCPCGWRPDLGTHYAKPEHAKSWRCDMYTESD